MASGEVRTPLRHHPVVREMEQEEEGPPYRQKSGSKRVFEILVGRFEELFVIVLKLTLT